MKKNVQTAIDDLLLRSAASMSSENEASPPPNTQGQAATIATPLNLILLSLFVIIIYQRFLRRQRPSTAASSSSGTATLPPFPEPIVFKTFTPRTLRPFDGSDGKPVYLAVKGRVFDVSPGRNFYGPGGPYSNFAGRDASRGLACGSFDEDMLTVDLDGPLDDLKGLGEEELGALQGWDERFSEKYLVVGKLVAVGSHDTEMKM